jgi:hypothetical protein
LTSQIEFLVGREVVEMEVDEYGSARIIFEVGDKREPALYADVAFAFERPGGGALAVPDLVGAVVSATSTEGGTLQLWFEDGHTLRCEPDPDIEAWEVVGGFPQELVVCTPGGDVAIIDSTHVPSEAEAQEVVNLMNEALGWDVRLGEVTETGAILVEDAPEAPETSE